QARLPQHTRALRPVICCQWSGSRGRSLGMWISVRGLAVSRVVLAGALGHEGIGLKDPVIAKSSLNHDIALRLEHFGNDAGVINAKRFISAMQIKFGQEQCAVDFEILGADLA